MGVWHPLVIILVTSLIEFALCRLDFQCLKCLCEAATQCVSTPCDQGKCHKIEMSNYECSCGPFGITPPFWIASNKPFLEDKHGGDVDKFRRCVETFPCSIWSIQYYMEKYAEDCDYNKVIDCDDYVLIHTYGPSSCRNNTLKGDRLNRYRTCMKRTEIIQSGGTRKSIKPTLKNTTEDTTESSIEDNSTTNDGVTHHEFEDTTTSKKLRLT